MIGKSKGQNIINAPKTSNIHILVRGNNNSITISPDMPLTTNIYLTVYGDDNVVQIGRISGGTVCIQMGYPDHRIIRRAKFICGNNHMVGVNFLMIEDDTRIIIGDNNRFSNEVDVRCTDDHCVLDENGNVLNRAESIIIGNDNWITRGVTILKNTVLLNESAIGTRSVFTKKMDRSNVVVAGNPARVVRENIKLDDERPDFYAYKHADQDRKGVDMFARQYSDVGYFAQNSTTSCKKNMSETSNIPKLNIKFLGIPVLRKKTKNNKVKYYVLGIHLLTVKIR